MQYQNFNGTTYACTRQGCACSQFDHKHVVVIYLFLIYKVLCYITYITQMIANNSICNSSYWTKITTQVKEFLTTLMMMSKTVTVAFLKCAEW